MSTPYRRYYAAHRDAEKARSAAYRADDPDGAKKERARASALKWQYKRNPTLKRAVSWYMAVQGDTNATLEAIKQWALQNGGIAVGESNATGGAARRSTVRPKCEVPAQAVESAAS